MNPLYQFVVILTLVGHNPDMTKSQNPSLYPNNHQETTMAFFLDKIPQDECQDRVNNNKDQTNNLAGSLGKGLTAAGFSFNMKLHCASPEESTDMPQVEISSGTGCWNMQTNQLQTIMSGASEASPH